jgi:SpoIIAA-like
MTLTLTFPNGSDLALVVAAGPITDDDVAGLEHQLLARLDRPSRYDILIDATQAMPEVAFPELKRMAGRFAGLTRSGLGRVAVVASQDLTYGLARAYSAYAEQDGLEAGAFRTEREARDWLGCAGGGGVSSGVG